MKSVWRINEAFKKVFKIWKKDLDSFTEDDLLKQLNIESWTLGQVYNHLINSTLQFHLKQVAICLASSDNRSKRKNFKGFLAYIILNGFPPIKINVPASDFYTPKQPESKQEILDGFAIVEVQMDETVKLFSNNKNGKTSHPGFSFINATEWYRIIEMHWRHHLRQKQEIEKKVKLAL